MVIPALLGRIKNAELFCYGEPRKYRRYNMGYIKDELEEAVGKKWTRRFIGFGSDIPLEVNAPLLGNEHERNSILWTAESQHGKSGSRSAII
jgi:hypothetical protein